MNMKSLNRATQRSTRSAIQHGGGHLGLCGATALALLSGTAPVAGQSALERNLPPERSPVQASISIDPQDFGNPSAEPFGVDLTGVSLIGETQAVATRPATGITGAPQGIDAAAIETALAPFLGQPLSLDLAARIQAAIAGVYRDSGRPFVSVTLPPQEITAGVLQLRVIEFRLGTANVSGANEAEAARIRGSLRVEPGQPIDARALDEDLNWLNRSPYLSAEGTFRPGAETSLTDLEVPVEQAPPFSVTAGWSNTGSEATGRDRYFVGFGASLAPLEGAWMSYQLTGSTEFWDDPTRILPETNDYPSYLSHSGRFVFPIAPRQALEVVPNYVVSREDADAFTTFENTTFELPVIYRSAVSNFIPGRFQGDLYGGLEFKSLERTTFFGGTEVADGRADVVQVVLGWSNVFTDPDDARDRTTIDASLRFSPGSLTSDNTDAAWTAFSNGRVDKTTYAYASANGSHLRQLTTDLAWLTAATGQIASSALPDSERLSLGGLSAVRGYAFDDVSVDSGVVWRNEARFPALSPLADALGQPDTMSTFVFADIGIGRDIGTGTNTSVAGVGLGLDYYAGDNLTANVVAGHAFEDAGMTEAGDWTVNAFLQLSF